MMKQSSLTNFEMQEFIKKGYSEAESTFDISCSKGFYQNEISLLLQKKNTLERKIQSLKKFSNNKKFKGKNDELYQELMIIDSAIEKVEAFLNVDIQVLRDYIQQRTASLTKLSQDIYDKKEVENNNYYQDLVESFKDDSEFLSTIQEEKESNLKKMLEGDTTFSKLNTFATYGDVLNTSLQNVFPINEVQSETLKTFSDLGESSENEEEIRKGFLDFFKNSYNYSSAHLSHLTVWRKDVKEFLTYVGKSPKDKILFNDLAPKNLNKKNISQYEKVSKWLPFVLSYYGPALCRPTKINSLLDAASHYVQSMDRLKELEYSLEDILHSLSFWENIQSDQLETLSKSLRLDQLTPTEISEQLKLSQKKLSIDMKNLNGLKAIMNFYEKLPLECPDTLSQGLTDIFLNMLAFWEEILKKVPYEQTEKYTCYSKTISEFNEQLENSYERFNSLLRKFVKNPSIIDKFFILLIISNSCHSLLNKSGDTNILDVSELMIIYWYEEILANAKKHELSLILNVSSFLSSFKEHLKNVVTLEKKYPKLYQEQYWDDYFWWSKYLEGSLNYFSYFEDALKYADSTIKNIFSIQNFLSQVEDDINGESVSNYKDVILQNWHRLPYNDTIIVHSEKKDSWNQEEQTIELHQVRNPNYIGMLRFNSFEKAISREKFNQLLADINKKNWEDISVSSVKQRTVLQQQKTHRDISGIRKVDSDFWWMLMLHTTWEISVNGINEDGFRYIIGDELYDAFQGIVLKNIASCLEVIDKRGVDWSLQTSNGGVYDQPEIHQKDPRKIYDEESLEHGGKKNLFYRKEHIRLLHENMITGYIGWQKAKENWIKLYACIYESAADPKIEDPLQTIDLDTFGDSYEVVKEGIKQLRNTYNTDTSFIRFQTYVDEYLKEWKQHQWQTITILNPHGW